MQNEDANASSFLYSYAINSHSSLCRGRRPRRPSAGTIVTVHVARGIPDAPDGTGITLKIQLFRDVEDAFPYTRDTHFLHGASRMPRATFLFEQIDKSEFTLSALRVGAPYYNTNYTYQILLYLIINIGKTIVTYIPCSIEQIQIKI